ncbi:MAG: hypothetical protein QXW00_03355 [Candidatus Woesearchaeota archaeon]
MRRAQTEILGIAIAVVILILLVLFVVGLTSSNAKKPSVTKEVQYSKLAWSFVNALVSTSYGEGTIKDALEKCGEDPQSKECENVKQVVTQILDSSLGVRKEDYKFTASYGESQIMEINKLSKCSNLNSGEVVLATLQGKPLKASLKICIK